jgi:HSP20 family molecular chaperone IbpA
MPVDININEEACTITVDMPGVNSKDIDIEYVDGLLTIKGTRHNVRKGHEYSSERRSSFTRSIRLEDVDEKNIQATYDNGVLNIVAKRVEARTAIKIPVTHATPVEYSEKSEDKNDEKET